MLDIQYIRDNPELIAEKSKQKGYPVDIRALLKHDVRRRTLLSQIEDLRQRRNEQAAAVKGQRPSDEQLALGRQLKEDVARLEDELSQVEAEYLALLKQVPNIPLDAVPIGASEAENKVAKTVGEHPAFAGAPKPHWAIAEPRDLIDKERAGKVSGSRFAYLKGDLVRLQFAIIQFVLQALGDETVIERLVRENDLDLVAKPFTPVLPPAMLRTEPYVASARLNAEEVTYRAGLPEDDVWLNASAEHTLCTMYWNEILPEDLLPIRYIGYSTSFRREAGTYGKDTEGIIRMHQFDKLEMEVFSTAETGLDEHKLLIAVQEYLVQQLGLPYRLLQKCTYDIGKPNASGYDVECWFPGQNRYIETHTADYMTDYQARDLKIRTRRTDGGKVELVHTNDATAFALGRIMAAIIENYQTADGHVRVPDVLLPFIGGLTEL
ncbi:MAG TPA: serine--tRNA ligase [Candidatus Saccharimonadales bacterium]|nr:serine--tRNA ligase [Candidatus Saccharimonadales bacterium]